MTKPPADGPILGFLKEEHLGAEALISTEDFGDAKRALAAFQGYGRRLERRIAWEEGTLFPAMARALSEIERPAVVSCRGCCASQRPGLGLRAPAALDPAEMRCPACGLATLAGAGEDHARLRSGIAEVLQALKNGDAEAARVRARALRDFLAAHHAIEERVLYPACDQVLEGERAGALLAVFGR